ncbi:MAG: FAD:protein FMN transferase [Ilumatobacteraceae bacterium]
MTSDVHAGSWRAMGCTVDVAVVGGSPDLLVLARTSIDHLERRWSRFKSQSDISRLNHAAGSTVHIDPATVVLLQAMLDGWRATSGAFDPTLLVPLVGLGYAASWNDPTSVTSLPHGALLRSDLGQLAIDSQRNLACIPAGMCLDPGGIGKGLAADLVVGTLLAAGACGASVSIGGDVAVRGAAPQDGAWLVGVSDPMNLELENAQLTMIEGGVATSGTLRRRWNGDDGSPVHHLLDPATGKPAHHGREIVAVTVIAGTAAWAEVWTKAVMVRGAAAVAVLDEYGLGAQLTYADRSTMSNRSWSTYELSGEPWDDLVGDEVEMIEV